MLKCRLFQPIALRSVKARNRIVASPMCQYRSIEGSPGDWQLLQFGRYALGGAGIVFSEETAVEARGRKTYECAGLYTDEHVEQYRRITKMIRSLGAIPAMQLGHAGSKAATHGQFRDWEPLTDDDARRGSPPWPTISASTVPSETRLPAPRAMSPGDIREVIDAWKSAARRAHDAGFEILEIHGAHGYLIHQFLSPLTNHRTDAYGGDRQSRMRFALELTEAVRDSWPDDKPLFFRASCVDGGGGIWSMDDTVALVKALRLLGVDVFDCSSGGINGTSNMPRVPRTPGYHVPFARRVKHEADIMTLASGLITEPAQAEGLLQEGAIDLVGMARELMWSADWPIHAAKTLGLHDYFDLCPPAFSIRLKQRERHLQSDLRDV